MREDPQGGDAAIPGGVIADPNRLVTSIGGECVFDWLHGEQLPTVDPKDVLTRPVV